MKQKEIIVPYDSMPQLHIGSFLTKEQEEQFKDVFKNIIAVIRCKDCKHRLECDYWIVNGDDWFCADGKRKEE